MMLRQLVKVTDAYPLTETDIALITTASCQGHAGKDRFLQIKQWIEFD